MIRVAVFTLVLALATPAASAGTLADAGSRPQAGACDPTPELEAAKRAAAAGDQAAAVEHLLRADAILAACEQDPAQADPSLGPESPEREVAHSGRVGLLGRG